MQQMPRGPERPAFIGTWKGIVTLIAFTALSH